MSSAAALSSSRAGDESDHVILPPPTALNPIPSLPAALRIDNKERFLELLLKHPCSDGVDIPSAVEYGTTADASFRQLLVFGKDSLRTLLMRQVLQDPHTRTFGKTGGAKGSAAASKNKNWDDSTSFPLPRSLQTNVVGTKVLMKQKTTSTNANDHANANDYTALRQPRSRTTWLGAEELSANASGAVSNSQKDEDLFRHPDELFQHVDVISYFLRPWDIDQTMAVIGRIKGCALNAVAVASEGTNDGTGLTRTHKQHHRIVYVPQITALCAQVLKDHRVYNPSSPKGSSSVSVCSLQLDLFPLETDLISLEYEDTLKEAGNVGGTPSGMIETTSRALRKLQDAVGRIPRIQSLGIWGEEVLAKLLNETVDERYADEKEENGEEKISEDEENDGDEDADHDFENDDNGTAMMLLDRRLDMVTPMVTPLTYEGLLDELVGIDCGFIGIAEQIINPSEDEEESGDGKKKKEDNKKSNNPFETDSSPTTSSNPFDDDAPDAIEDTKIVTLGVHAGDSLFAEVRDQHVEQFGSFLQNQAVALKESHANFTSRETKKDLNEIHTFVKQIPIFTQSLRSLTNHIHLAELIKATTEDVAFRDQWNSERAMIEGESCYDILEERIFENYPPYKLLRLLCLQSLTSGGIKANRYDQLKQYIVQVYGYEFLSILHDLETMGWIKKMEGNLATNFVMDSANRSLFQNIKRNLILIHAEVNTVKPDDVSYVSSGYAPLTVRLIQSAMQGWHTPDKEDILRDLFQMMASNNSGSGGNGRLLDVRQTYPPRDLPTTLRKQRQSKSSSRLEPLGAYGKKRTNSKKKPTLIVVYLGGITFMEIAALRFLSNRETFPYHIVVVTTRVLNGSKLIQQMG
ncbi:unnamed protein product [Pseudo-nitzschia multistriata]|uniref:Uncharacterized protein n=1 Tax=Pseudo-nitzschia multistriata TaxID=183589 RepID=A0A448ZBH3_9STRA|nr:unnamed protein product [Pseudo-nitzschia multistriata]